MSTRRRAPAGLLAATTVSLLLAATACSGSSGRADTATTTAPAATITTLAPATTLAAATTTTAAPAGAGPTTFFPDAQSAIDHLTAAWQANDRASALQGATAIAVQDIFTQSASGFAVYGCQQGGINASTCNWRNRATGGYAQIEAVRKPQGWIVGSVYMDTDG